MPCPVSLWPELSPLPGMRPSHLPGACFTFTPTLLPPPEDTLRVPFVTLACTLHRPQCNTHILTHDTVLSENLLDHRLLTGRTHPILFRSQCCRPQQTEALTEAVGPQKRGLNYRPSGAPAVPTYSNGRTSERSVSVCAVLSRVTVSA